MRGPASLGASISHQVTAFRTLSILLQQKGLSNDNRLQEPQTDAVDLNYLHNAEDGPSTSGCFPSNADIVEDDPALNSIGTQLHSPCPLLITRTEQGASVATSSNRPFTLAEIASRNRLCRVTSSTAQLLSVEQNMLNNQDMENHLTIQLKDSIEFRNICTHMALQVEGRQFDRDLSAAQQCIRTITTDLLQSLRSLSSDFHKTASADLRQILQNLSDV
ncbi:leukemia-associated protein 7 [Discoglossus pictus]